MTNEQAYVEGTEAKWWTMITPKRRQELALGGMIALTLGVVGLVVALVRRARRRRLSTVTAGQPLAVTGSRVWRRG